MIKMKLYLYKRRNVLCYIFCNMWPYTIVFDLDISGSGSIRIIEWTEKIFGIELIVSFRTQIEFHMI